MDWNGVGEHEGWHSCKFNVEASIAFKTKEVKSTEYCYIHVSLTSMLYRTNKKKFCRPFDIFIKWLWCVSVFNLRMVGLRVWESRVNCILFVCCMVCRALRLLQVMM